MEGDVGAHMVEEAECGFEADVPMVHGQAKTDFPGDVEAALVVWAEQITGMWFTPIDVVGCGNVAVERVVELGSGIKCHSGLFPKVKIISEVKRNPDTKFTDGGIDGTFISARLGTYYYVIIAVRVVKVSPTPCGRDRSIAER